MRIWSRYRDVIIANWHIGFTAFGGPAVQFQTVRHLCQEKECYEWTNGDTVSREICNTFGMD